MKGAVRAVSAADRLKRSIVSLLIDFALHFIISAKSNIRNFVEEKNLFCFWIVKDLTEALFSRT